LAELDCTPTVSWTMLGFAVVALSGFVMGLALGHLL
jgi:hypothetical protein